MNRSGWQAAEDDRGIGEGPLRAPQASSPSISTCDGSRWRTMSLTAFREQLRLCRGAVRIPPSAQQMPREACQPSRVRIRRWGDGPICPRPRSPRSPHPAPFQEGPSVERCWAVSVKPSFQTQVSRAWELACVCESAGRRPARSGRVLQEACPWTQGAPTRNGRGGVAGRNWREGCREGAAGACAPQSQGAVVVSGARRERGASAADLTGEAASAIGAGRSWGETSKSRGAGGGKPGEARPRARAQVGPAAPLTPLLPGRGQGAWAWPPDPVAARPPLGGHASRTRSGGRKGE